MRKKKITKDAYIKELEKKVERLNKQSRLSLQSIDTLGKYIYRLSKDTETISEKIKNLRHLEDKIGLFLKFADKVASKQMHINDKSVSEAEERMV